MRKHRKRRIRRAKAAARAATRATVKSKEDRISDLPDCMIHHILSFLPSTKEAIRTSILSKRWLNQWTYVPVLIFNDSKDISPKKFLNFVDNTLIRHDSSKVKKFHLKYDVYSFMYDLQLDSKILFATQKHVEELYLSSYCYWQNLPQLLFNTAPSSLVKLTVNNFNLMPDRKVNWGCLTSLTLDNCELTDQAVQYILSGSTLLESFELINCSNIDKLVIASKSLKKLVLRHDRCNTTISAIEISCPNLVELSLSGVTVVGDANLFAYFLSKSPLLKSLELNIFHFPLPHDQLVIASKSLKRLFIRLNCNIFHLHLSCPQLELLVLYGWFNLKTSKLLDLPSSLCATFDFHYFEEPYDDYESSISMVKDILQQLGHVKQLTFGNLFIKILSTLRLGDPFPSVLNVKSLTLNFPNLNNHYSGIARLLRHAPELEKLVINIPIYDEDKVEQLDDFGENFWNPDDSAVFNCLVSHLKTIKIIGVWYNQYELKSMMSFVQFLLKNARVLEKMIVITKGSKSASKRISNKLFHLPRCSKDVVVELVTLKPEMFETCHYIYTNN